MSHFCANPPNCSVPQPPPAVSPTHKNQMQQDLDSERVLFFLLVELLKQPVNPSVYYLAMFSPNGTEHIWIPESFLSAECICFLHSCLVTWRPPRQGFHRKQNQEKQLDPLVGKHRRLTVKWDQPPNLCPRALSLSKPPDIGQYPPLSEGKLSIWKQAFSLSTSSPLSRTQVAEI